MQASARVLLHSVRTVGAVGVRTPASAAPVAFRASAVSLSSSLRRCYSNASFSTTSSASGKERTSTGAQQTRSVHSSSGASGPKVTAGYKPRGHTPRHEVLTGIGPKPRVKDNYVPPTPQTFLSPHVPGYKLKETSVGLMYSNLVHLCGKNRTIRPHFFERLLERVTNVNDLGFAMDGLKLCRTRFVKFTPHTVTALVKACCRAGQPETAVDLLRNHKKWRLFPTRAHYIYLAQNAGRNGDGDVLTQVNEAFGQSRLGHNWKTRNQWVKSFIDCDNLTSAVKHLHDAHAEGSKLKPGTFNKVTAYVTQQSVEDLSEISRGTLAKLQTVLPAAKSFADKVDFAMLDSAIAAVVDATALSAELAAAAEAEAEASEEAGEEGADEEGAEEA